MKTPSLTVTVLEVILFTLLLGGCTPKRIAQTTEFPAEPIVTGTSMNPPETNAAADTTHDQQSNLVGNVQLEDRININAGDALRETEIQAAQPHASEEEFSIDELREIARHFRVPHREQIIDRGQLLEAIRRRLQ